MHGTRNHEFVDPLRRMNEAVEIDRTLRTMPDGKARDRATDRLIGLELKMLSANQMGEYAKRRSQSSQ